MTASLGNLFLLADGTTLRASDAASGRVLWRRPLEGGAPVRTVDPGSRAMAVIDGGLLFTQEGGYMPALRLGDPLQILDELVVDGRHFVLDQLDADEVAATTTQAGLKTTLSVYGLGKRWAIEVYDRRGGRVERFVAAHAHVRSAGERLVISVGNDLQHSYVVRGPT